MCAQGLSDFLGCLCFFDGDLSVLEGDGENLVAFCFCPVGNCCGVGSAAKDDYGFFCVLHLRSLLMREPSL